MPEFVPPDLPVGRVETIAPAIDPLSPKNIELDPRTASQILDWIGVDLPGRLVTQVSRFDPWKDPLGVIEAYRLVREEVAGTCSSRSSARWRSTTPRGGTSTARSPRPPSTTP